MTGTAFSPFSDGGGRKAQDRSWGEQTHLSKGTLSSDCSLDLFVVSLPQE